MKARQFTLIVLASLAAHTAHAATFNWTNLNGGTWDTSGGTINWAESLTPAVAASPTFTADEVLDFSTKDINANRTTTLDGDHTAGKLKFGDAATVSHNWIVNTGTSGKLTLSTTTGTPTIEVVDSRHVATINAEIAGTQGFSKTNSGQLVLAGSNSYSGETTLSAGTLTFAVPAAIPSTSAITAASATTLALRVGTGGFTSANLDSLFAGTFPNVTLTAARIGIDTTTANFTYSSSVSGASGLTKIGANKLTISGTNTYKGGTFVPAILGVTNSTVDVSGDQSGADGGWGINAGGTVNFLAGSTVAVATGKSITLSNESAATHTLNVAGTVTGTGNLAVHAGSVVNINSGAVWTQTGNLTIQPLQSFSTPIMNVNTGGSFTYTGTALGPAISLSSSINSNGGSATLNLSGGTFTTNKAFNNAAAATATAGGANLTFSNGGTLKLSGIIDSLATTVGRPFTVQLGNGGGVIDTNGFNTSLAFSIANMSGQSGSLTKKGEGILTLTSTAANTYTGATTVNGGTLSVSATDQFSDTAALSLDPGTTLNLNFTGLADIVGCFRINGITQAAGVWGRIGSGAAHESAMITGDGLIENTNLAAEFYWDGTGNTWASATAWSYAITDPTNNPPAVPDFTSTAFFGGNSVISNQTVKLGENRELLKLSFISPVLFNFTGGGTDSTLTVGAPGINLVAGSGGATFGSTTANEKVIPTLGASQTWTNLSTGVLTTVNGVDLGSSTLTIVGASGTSTPGSGIGSFILGGGVTGGGGLRKMGYGSLTFDGTDTFSGDKIVDRGSITVRGNQTAATGSWILRGFGDSGSTFNTINPTVTFDTTSTVAIATDKMVQLGNTASVGGFSAQTLDANGAVTNDGSLFVGRGGRLNVSGAWIQTSTATVASQGGGTAVMTVKPSGTFNYTSTLPFLLTSSASLNVPTDLTLDGGTFTTGVNFNNSNSTPQSGTASRLILTNGGTLKLTAEIGDLFTTAGATNSIVVGTGGGIVNTNGFSTTLNVPISGTGGLTKAGAGKLTTTGINSYTGDTTVSGGILSLSGPDLADGSAVTIANGAKLDLPFAGTDTVAKLTINGVTLPEGTYSATTHASFITGEGSLTVVRVGFAGWAANLVLSGDPKADFDKDGMSDAAEFVLGSDPRATSSSGITGQKSGSDLVFTFNRSDDSETSDVAVMIEAGSTLGVWPQVFQVGSTTANSSSGVVITENGAAPDTVVVTIPTSAAPSLFARLKVVVSGS